MHQRQRSCYKGIYCRGVTIYGAGGAVVFIRRSYSRAATISRILYQDPFTIAYNIRGRLLKVQRGNRVFPVVFPVGGASLVASPLRSDYPSYAPVLPSNNDVIEQQVAK